MKDGNHGHLSNDDALELARLLDAYCNQRIGDGDFARLGELLHGSREARARFRRVMTLNATLYECADAEMAGEEMGVVPMPGADGSRFASPGRVAAIVALAACLIGLTFVLLRFFDLPAVPLPTESAAVADGAVVPPAPEVTVAVLTSVVEAVWGSGGVQPRSGGGLGLGSLVLESGLAQIDFVSGASVVLEGPARLEVISSMRCVLHEGKVRSHVPPQARGFTITSAEASFTDLGTDFGLEVLSSGAAELHVFEGEVEAMAEAGKPRLVTGGKGLALDGDAGAWTNIPTEENRFVDSRRMAELTEEAGSGRYRAWQAARERLLARADLVSYFDFESHSAGSTTLENRAALGTHGAIVGCRWTEGRWPDKRALDFKRPTDRVRFFVPGDFASVTLMASIRIDGYDRLFNSIMLTDGFDAGEMHWQVKSDGVMDLGIKPPGDYRLLFLSPALLGFEDLGRWLQVAVVIDRGAGTVTHYLDGRAVAVVPMENGNDDGRAPVTERFPLRIGDAQLGNWAPPPNSEGNSPLRNFNGRMDEFAVFASALTAAEIRAFYEAGRP